MPDKLTDKEIVKALEDWIKELKDDYKRLQLLDAPMDCFEESHVDSIRELSNALDLINRLQEENEKLQNFKAYFDFYYGNDIEILGIDENGDTTTFDEFYNCAIANAESIEHHIAHIIKIIKAEAYKEFAEKNNSLIDSLIEKYSIKDFKEFKAICQILRGIKNDTNNLLKELVGDNK